MDKTYFNRFFLRASIIIMTGVLTISCDDDADEVPLADNSTYIPLSKGIYQIYSVSETTFTNGPEGEVDQYELRTIVVDSFMIEPTIFQYVIHRSRRNAPQDEWTYLDTWSAVINKREAIVQEENVSFVKLALPAILNRSWNGNAYNSLGAESYTISKLEQNFALGTLSFENTVEVTQRNEVDNIIGNDIRKEIYADGVGLIYRKIETITYCSNTPDCLGNQVIEQGLKAEYIIKEYGKE
jgi:hypothetical protein